MNTTKLPTDKMYVDLLNPKQFDPGDVCIHHLVEHIHEAHSEGGLVEFFNKAGADLVFNTNDGHELNDEFFALGFEVGQKEAKSPGFFKIYWIEVGDCQAFWISPSHRAERGILRNLACTLYGIPVEA